ncbi:glycosyltransferase family protein [Pseudodesulfovibrio alkaliphilus]|nr:DUF3880 domain-containing protein [Pseudodesulfovibrio alkaliphilus]
MVPRPARVRIVNELGNAQTLPDGPDQFEVLPGGPDAVFLGLGPDPARTAALFPNFPTADFLECPAMAEQVVGWAGAVPAGFTPLTPGGFTTERAASATVIRYRPGLKAFPSFYAPLAARAALAKARVAPSRDRGRPRTVWLPTAKGDLMTRELVLAFESRGFRVVTVEREGLERSPGTELPGMLAQDVPDLFLSVNFRGLEPFGLGFSLLREAGARVAVWLVDNPCNLLTGIKSGFWRRARLFVTDHSFIGPLIGAGAHWVRHLPLATSPELFARPGPLPDCAQGLADRLVFVGRSAFPHKERFFAGLVPDPSLLAEAGAMLDNGQRPDHHWWRRRVPAPLWPGSEIRRPGAGAEAAGHLWRTRCLTGAGPQAVVFGDEGWQAAPGLRAELRPPLDYYAALPAVYGAAGASLNVTGMQLPAGLTQRHFDVWCAGGLLLTDANPGLSIFPAELTGPITFAAPKDIEPLFQSLCADPATPGLRRAWRELILGEHTYAHRVDAIVTALGL